MHGGLQSLQGFADRRDSKKKVTALYALTGFITVLSAVSAVWMLVQLQILSCAFDLAVAGLGILGFHATRHRQRSLLLLFVVGMAVLVGLGLLGLALSIVYSVFSFSLELAYLAVQLFLIAIEGLALILAYSLSKDLDPKRVATMGAPHDGSAMEAGEQGFTFEDDGHMHHPGAMMVNGPAPVYHQQPTTTPLGGNMPVYDPATGTYGGYPGQPMYNPYAPQMAVYPPPQQYAYPPQAMPYGSQQLPSVSPAPSVAAPAGDVFDFAQPNATAAQGTYTIDDDDDEFDPFHEQPSAH
jgi:hypothetical protein